MRQSINGSVAGLVTLVLGLSLPGPGAPHVSAAKPAAGGSVIQLVLTPAGSSTVAQGLAFRVNGSMTNTGPTPLDVSALFSLRSLDHPGARVSFALWLATVASGETVRTTRQVTSARWFTETGLFQVSAVVQQQASADLTYTVSAPPVLPPRFVDVTQAAGIGTSLPAPSACQWSAGAAWADVDGDGDLDLYVPHPDGPAQLWINDGTGHFTDQATLRGVDNGGSVGIGATFADYDRDGHPDLYVTNIGSNRLYRNDGTGHFVDVAESAGVQDGQASFSSAWGDYDRDGWPDLYVVNYQSCFGQAGSTSDRLYHNNGDGSFTDVTALLPALSTDGAGFQAGWFDYDGDGDPDLYLANDSLAEVLTARNHLFRNDGPDGNGGWIFTDVSDTSRTNYEINSMGLAIGDYNRDLRLDFAVSNIGPTVLARNNGDGTFTDVASSVGVARPLRNANRSSITWGLSFADLNLDGWEDLYVNAGALLTREPQPNELFVNGAGLGRFLDLSALSGLADPGVARGVAFADYDGDGRLDLFVVNQGGPAHLYRNVTPHSGQHWLELRLHGSSSNTDACGATLAFTVAGGQMLREVFCGSTGLSSGSDPMIHVGLGTAAVVDQVDISWPSGQTQTLTAIPADRVLSVTEPVRR